MLHKDGRIYEPHPPGTPSHVPLRYHRPFRRPEQKATYAANGNSLTSGTSLAAPMGMQQLGGRNELKRSKF